MLVPQFVVQLARPVFSKSPFTTRLVAAIAGEHIAPSDTTAVKINRFILISARRAVPATMSESRSRITHSRRPLHWKIQPRKHEIRRS
jgi:hypothetical protein